MVSTVYTDVIDEHVVHVFKHAGGNFFGEDPGFNEVPGVCATIGLIVGDYIFSIISPSSIIVYWDINPCGATAASFNCMANYGESRTRVRVRVRVSVKIFSEIQSFLF